jgi:hypothetical protein
MVKQMMIKLENDGFFKRVGDMAFGGIGIISIISQILIVSNQISKVPNKSLFNNKINFSQRRVDIPVSIKMKEIYRIINYDIYKKRLDCIPIFDNGNFKWLRKLLLDFPWILFIIIAYFNNDDTKNDAHYMLNALTKFNENVENNSDYNEEKEIFIQFANENHVLNLENGIYDNKNIYDDDEYFYMENNATRSRPKRNKWTRSNNDNGYGRYTKNKGGKSRRHRRRKSFRRH